MCQAYEDERRSIVLQESAASKRKWFDLGKEAAVAGCPESYVPSNCYEKKFWNKGWQYGFKNKEKIIEQQKIEEQNQQKRLRKNLKKEKEKLNRILNENFETLKNL